MWPQRFFKLLIQPHLHSKWCYLGRDKGDEGRPRLSASSCVPTLSSGSSQLLQAPPSSSGCFLAPPGWSEESGQPAMDFAHRVQFCTQNPRNSANKILSWLTRQGACAHKISVHQPATSVGVLTHSAGQMYPPPPLPSPTPCNLETVTSMFFLVIMYCAGLCCPSALRMALLCFPKHRCVFCDILSPKALCGYVVLLFQTQDVEDQFCEWLLPIWEKISDKNQYPCNSPPSPLGRPSLGGRLPPPPRRRPSRANPRGMGGTYSTRVSIFVLHCYHALV